MFSRLLRKVLVFFTSDSPKEPTKFTFLQKKKKILKSKIEAFLQLQKHIKKQKNTHTHHYIKSIQFFSPWNLKYKSDIDIEVNINK